MHVSYFVSFESYPSNLARWRKVVGFWIRWYTDENCTKLIKSRKFKGVIKALSINLFCLFNLKQSQGLFIVLPSEKRSN